MESDEADKIYEEYDDVLEYAKSIVKNFVELKNRPTRENYTDLKENIPILKTRIFRVIDLIKKLTTYTREETAILLKKYEETARINIKAGKTS